MNIEKFISQQIERQFPSIYREDGQELVAFIKAYYEWLESTQNQSLYNSRRLLEYRDIDSTLEKMLLFFKNKYMADLPYDPNTVRHIIKNILDLYRRRGSDEGLQLFFRLFYNTEVSITYPGGAMLKPSSSEWFVGRYLQMYPTNPDKYKDVVGKSIVGVPSKAEGVINNVLLMVLNGAITPVIYVDEVKGSFAGDDEIYINDEFSGVVYGSLKSGTIVNDGDSGSGYKVGDLLTTDKSFGLGGKALVTSVTEQATGEVKFTLVDGGYGYTANNTDVYISDQLIFPSNTDLEFEILETLRDQANNVGIVIGQALSQGILRLGVKMVGNSEFSNTSIIETVDRDIPIVVDYSLITPKNTTASFEVGDLDYTTNVSIITDVIENFANVVLSSSNYNDIPPALVAFTGTDPVDIDTVLSDAFDLTPITIGRIANLVRIDPGIDYVNDVFTVIVEPVINVLDIKNQILYFAEAVPSYLQVGRIISQGSKLAEIKKVISGRIHITPFTIERFEAGQTIQYADNELMVMSVEVDYDSLNYGFNAVIDSTVEFAIGRITGIRIIDSGYGYRHRSLVTWKDEQGETATKTLINAKGQGVTEGVWTSTASHLNYDSGQRLQDSFYYQAFSYEVNSKIDINTYEKFLKETIHPAGIQFFGNFQYDEELDVSSDISVVINR